MGVHYLKQGYSLIPVNTEKKPLVKWREYQRRQPTQDELAGWALQFPDMQLAIVTGAISGLVVVDVEAGGDHTQFPDTLMAKTGGGGYHLYYKHPGHPVKTDAKQVGELVDIRGDGGYVVVAPSISTKGEYEWLSDPFRTKKAPYPGEIIESLRQIHSEKLIAPGERNVAATQKAGEILAQLPNQADRAKAWEQLQEWNQTALTEPLEDSELQKVFISISGREEGTKKGGITLKPYTLKELYAEKYPPIEWLVDGLVPIGMLGAITGESSSYKSFLTQVMAQAVATNTPFLGEFGGTVTGKVLIIDEENSRRIINKRFHDMGIEAHDNIVFLSQTGLQLNEENHMEALQRVVDEVQPVLIIFDSLVRFHGLEENSATEMGKVMRWLRSFVKDSRSVVFIHHHKKTQGPGTTSGSSGVRGSTDIFNALDFHLGVKKNGVTITVTQHKLRIDKEAEPFKVLVDGIGQAISFTYSGRDTTHDDRINEAKQLILSLLHDAAGEEVMRKELADKCGVTSAAFTEALNQLHEEEEIVRRTGAHNAHLYSLPGPSDETVDSAEETEEVPY